MKQNLAKFSTESDYTAFTTGETYVEPNVSLVSTTNDLHYNKLEQTSPANNNAD